jgi:type I restriction-modification system DNA methylase subunit
MKVCGGTDLDGFEIRLLRSYLVSKSLDFDYFLSKFYSRSEFEDSFGLLDLFQHTLSLWDLINTFETTIDEKFKKLNGAFYTPLFVVDYITNRIILENHDKDINVIDPACGSGIFLVSALFKLKQKTGKSYKELVEKNLFGIDIDPRAVKRTKIVLSLVVFEEEGEIPQKFNIYNGNSLDRKFLKSILNDQKFSAVVGNPPYVRIQNLDENTRNLIRKYWRFIQGDTDIFIPFFELGIELLKEGGRMGYITPNSYC